MLLSLILCSAHDTALSVPTCIAVAPTGHTVAAGCSDGNVYLVDAAAGVTRSMLASGKGSFLRLDWSSDGKRLCAAASQPGDRPGDAEHVYVESRSHWIAWDVARGTLLLDEPDSGPAIHGPVLDASPDGERLVTRGNELWASLWDLDLGVRIAPLDRAVLTTTAAWSTDSKTLFTGDASGQVCGWNAADGRLRKATSLGGGTISALCSSPDGRHLLVASVDPVALACVSVDGMRVEWQRELRLGGWADDHLFDLAVAPDSTRVIATATTGLVESFDVRDGRHSTLLQRDDFFESGVGVSFAPDGDRIAVWAHNFVPRVLDATGGSDVASIATLGVCGGRGSLAWTSDGRHLVARCKELVVLDGTSFEIATRWSPGAR